MNRTTPVLALVAALAACAAAGCAAPALKESQRLQLAAMKQHRAEMQVYHERVQDHLLREKRAALETALEASLAQSADDEGRVDVATALEKVRKRDTLEEEFRANLGRLDAQFAERQESIGRAIDLAEGSLALLEDYSRLGALVRSLFVRELEARNLVTAYETERSANHGERASEP